MFKKAQETAHNIKEKGKEVTEKLADKVQDSKDMLVEKTHDLADSVSSSLASTATAIKETFTSEPYATSNASTCSDACAHLLHELVDSSAKKHGVLEDLGKTAMFNMDQCMRHCNKYWDDGTVACVTIATKLHKADKCMYMDDAKKRSIVKKWKLSHDSKIKQ